MKRIYLVIAVALLLASAIGSVQARPGFVPILTKTYPANAGPLQQRSCINCHVSMSNLQRNAYGKEIETAMDSAKASDLTPAILHQVENMDAAGDGVTNLTRIKEGLPPAGTPASKGKVGVVAPPSGSNPS